MAGLFGKAKTPKMPPVAPPPATPEVGPETEDIMMKQARRRMGWRKTIITGALEPTPTGRKTVLG